VDQVALLAENVPAWELWHAGRAFGFDAALQLVPLPTHAGEREVLLEKLMTIQALAAQQERTQHG